MRMHKPGRLARLLALLLALLLGLLLAAHAAPASAMMRPQLRRLSTMNSASEVLRSLLQWMQEEDCPIRKGQRMGEWVLHPAGFAFCVPEGYAVSGDFRGSMVVLKDSGASSRQLQPTITLMIEDVPQESLASLTSERIARAYAGNFRRFSLQSYQRESIFGEEGIRITFTTHDSVAMRMQQRIFDKQGKRFYLTLMTPDTDREAARGRSCFGALCSSMVFAQ